MHMKRLTRWALAPLALLVLAACTGGDDEGTVAEPSSRTIGATLTDGDDFGRLEGVLTNAGLGDVLEGKGPYTVFAPSDAAFAAMGGADFASEAMRAQSVALLRAHIVPGALTRADIGAAIDRGQNQRVEMRTMADGLLTFSKDGETIVVTAPDGATARLTGDERIASNGAVQPIDALLVKPAETPAA